MHQCSLTIGNESSRVNSHRPLQRLFLSVKTAHPSKGYSGSSSQMLFENRSRTLPHLLHEHVHGPRFRFVADPLEPVAIALFGLLGEASETSRILASRLREEDAESSRTPCIGHGSCRFAFSSSFDLCQNTTSPALVPLSAPVGSRMFVPVAKNASSALSV